MIRSRVLELWRVRRYDLGSLLLLIGFFLLFFRPALFSGKFFVTSDAFIYSYPLRTLVWEQLRHGQLPLWTSQIMSGYPLLSMAQIGVGYPLTWFYLILPGRFAEAIYDIAPYCFFPLFIYCYLREVGRSRLASILAGLAFGYGGFLISPVAYNGLLGNALMWLPLVLIALERSRTRSFATCLMMAPGAYAMSVLTGVGQGFVIVAAIGLAYAAFMGLAPEWLKENAVDETSTSGSTAPSWLRWRSLLVMFGAIALAAGVAAFQILETLQAQRLSIRGHISFDLFALGSSTPADVARAFFLPLYYTLDASAYVAPLVLALAVIAIIATLRNPQRDWRVFFWSALAAGGFVLLLGENTPVYRLLYHIPPFNLFRGADRHACELTLAISVLAAYGWDAASAWFASSNSRGVNAIRHDKAFLPGIVLLALALLVGLLWWADLAKIPIGNREVYYSPPQFSVSRYATWKLSFCLLTIAAAAQAWRVHSFRRRTGLLLSVIVVACFFEPAIMVSRWWWPTLKPATRFSAASPTTRLLQAFPPEQNRIYTRLYPFVEEYVAQPRVEPVNLTILHGLQNVGGYEPLILERYSRALGNVYLDAFRPRPGFAEDRGLLEANSHVLDLLNDRFLVSYSDLATEPASPVELEGIKFKAREMGLTLNPGQAITLKGAAAEADTLALVTATAWSAEAVDGTLVARVRLVSSQGKIVERPLRLGIDTAEWAHERSNVRPLVRHSMASVFSSRAADENDPEPAYKFIARFSLGQRMRVEHIEITNLSKEVTLLLSHATLFDSATNFSMPLPHYDLDKWKPVYDRDGALVLRNDKALPRAWLVAEAEAVDAEEALRRIRGEGNAFDPRRTALLEIPQRDLPALPGNQISSAATARIVAYENNRMVIDATTDTATVLVVSEINYPGWIATVDGAPAPIHTADFLLRGVVLPPGSHRVEMRYTAPAARAGGLISIFTLLVIGGLVIYATRTARRIT